MSLQLLFKELFKKLNASGIGLSCDVGDAEPGSHSIKACNCCTISWINLRVDL